MTIKIIVATHKNYVMPSNRDLYLPIFVGKINKADVETEFKGDDTGENISSKNKSYNELTGLYWAWKNLDDDILGLVHYRRYLGLHKSHNIDDILTEPQIDKLFKKADIILPKKRNYWIETNYSHYVHAHRSEPIDAAKKVISEKYPEYLDSFNETMNRKKGHILNMFIMKRDDFDSYCSWMFDILAEVDQLVDTTSYSSYQKRFLGFVSERLLDVWVETNNKSTIDVPVIYLEKQHWIRKIFKFILRKFGGKQD